MTLPPMARHLVDSTSFPLVVPNTNLSAGAYHPSQRYSRRDVETVVKAAAERAIRVVPEFDLPAHTAPAWCVGEPTICSQSGSAVDPSADEDAYDCELLSKLWDEATAATLKQRGADATKRMEKESSGPKIQGSLLFGTNVDH